jgi:anti-anti-sigma regulatory factor
MSAPPAARSRRGSRFTEAVDWTGGRVSATGRLTPAAIDLLRGTAEQLRRAGHTRVTVDLHSAPAVDEDGLTALRSVAADLRVRHCEFVVRWAEKENRS